MAYKKFLAPLTGSERDTSILAGAFAAAKPFNAHVVALFVRPDPAQAMPFFGEGVSGNMAQEIVDVANEASDKAIVQARAALEKSAAESGAVLLPVPEPRNVLSASFREIQGSFADCVTRASRVCDVVVFGPLKTGDRPGLGEAFESVLLQSGRPVLLVAQTPLADLGTRIAVAWDGGTASAHALTGAMPYLARAKSIELVLVQRPGADPVDSGEAREYLALHGLSCNERNLNQGGKLIGEALLELSTAIGADTLVLGAYGQSRLRQLFAGGVTKHVVSHAKIPIFLVH